MKRTAFSNARGFSTIQLLLTITVMVVVTAFALVSISRARDHVRLMNSARQFAASVERARGDAVRRHGEARIDIVDTDTYSITMDWDGFGNTRAQSFNLERGVEFSSGVAVQFNWRGRIDEEQSFGFVVNRGSSLWQRTVNVHVTGSGDVTFDSDWFFDNQLPPGSVTGAGGNVLPEPGATPGSGYGSPTPSPSPGASPSPSPGASPSPSPSPTASASASPTASASPSPTGSASPSPTATATATAQPCVINGPSSVTIIENGSQGVSVYRTNVTGTGTISATSSNSGQIQVSPSSASVSGTAVASFTITVKKNSGSVTFSSAGCTSRTVDITVQ
jgi:hypothetical protein